jgi:FtsP/CotA-like multicopper oxidase with cupredoxin domain
MLTAAPGTARLVGASEPETNLWLYNGESPGPLLRYTEGDSLDVTLRNRLPEPTTIHWHGLRPPVGMDGMPYYSQPPVMPGEDFRYRFPLTESGTYWYHPHVNGSVQLGRGLNGPLIVDEETPPDVDRDILWILDDWRMDEEARLAPFGARHDSSHAGRFGNVVTVNGTLTLTEPVRAGERVRLRLLNVANARIFAPRFPMDRVWVVALDGRPVAPHVPRNGRVRLGPGARADLIIDMMGAPGESVEIVDDGLGPRGAYLLKTLDHADAPAFRDASTRSAPEPMRPHDLPEPDLETAERHALVLEGGAMGGLRGAHMGGRFRSMRDLVETGRFWALNGSVPIDMASMEPIFNLALDRSHVIQFVNQTAFPHPMHLHGHAFRVLSVNGAAVPHRPWRDTVMVDPADTVEIAFVADNPGLWMLHCHVLEHQDAGMMAVVAVG